MVGQGFEERAFLRARECQLDQCLQQPCEQGVARQAVVVDIEETGNEYLLRSFDRIWNRASSFRIFAAIETADPGASLGEHREIFLAVRDEAPLEAGEAMVAHIRDGLELQLGALADEMDLR